jgi:hypothetical protein
MAAELNDATKSTAWIRLLVTFAQLYGHEESEGVVVSVNNRDAGSQQLPGFGRREIQLCL